MSVPAARREAYWAVLLTVCAAVVAGCSRLVLAAEPEPAKTDAKAVAERQPVPAGPKVTDAEKQIREVFKDDYQKRSAAERTALARRLIKLAQESKADPPSCYVALREARDIAASAGDIDAAWAACEQLAETFAVDAGELKTAALSAVARSGVSGEAAAKAFDAGEGLLEQYASESHYDVAVKLLGPLEELARRANNAELAGALQSRAREVRAQQAEWAKVKPSFDKLKENPNDADAALVAGKYYIVSRGNWERALWMLVKSSSPALQQAAAKDLAEPAEAEARADVGDLWWAAAEKEAGALKVAMQQRGLNWYRQALEGLTAPRKQQVEKRVQGAMGAGSSIEGLKAAGLVFWVNPSADPSGSARELLSATAPKNVGAVPVVTDGGVKALKLNDTYPTYPTTEAVKGVGKTGSAFVWFRMDKSMGTYNGLFFKGTAPGPKTGPGRTDFTVMGYGERVIVFFNWPDNTWPGVEGKTGFYTKHGAVPGKWTMCGATWDGTTVSVYFNGEREASYKAASTPGKHGDAGIVGLGCDPPGANQGFIGLMGGAMIFNRALTDAEVRQVHAMAGVQGK
ncbi:MAG: LamG domain-containing protein [Planctomycetota bacterium]|nr:LamG domain-containing protein [Planctomycetota bacterium]